MIISKTNIIADNAIALSMGSILSGSLANLQDPDFSRIVSSNSSTFRFTISNVGACQYIALHGLNLPSGATVTVTATSFSKSFILTRSVKNLVFYVSLPTTPGGLIVEIIGSGTKTISYMQAGMASRIDWGTSSGQSLYYLANNKANRVTTTGQGMPTRRVQEINAPKLKLNIKNAYKAWARSDLQEIHALYDETGVLSELDYEEENRPDESCALFEMSNSDVSTHSQTTTLVDISMSFRVVA